MTITPWANTPKGNVQLDSRLAAFTAMAQLGSASAKMIADYEEEQSVMDAQNDQVNDSINPDKLYNQAAYAWTVAENDALKYYNSMSEAINRGDYKEMDPSDFQNMLKDGHKEYYKKWEGSPHSDGALKAYNGFMLQNQSRITSAQAGAYRLDQKDKQGTALSVKIAEMAKLNMNPFEDYTSEIEDPKYSLLDYDSRIGTILTGIGGYAKESGNVGLMEQLDKHYGLSASPKFHSAFESIMTAANRKRSAVSDAAVLKQLTVIDKLAEDGILTESFFSEISDMKDSNGNTIISPEKFFSYLKKSAMVATGMKDTDILNELVSLDESVDKGELSVDSYKDIAGKKNTRGTLVISPEQYSGLIAKSKINYAKLQAIAKYTLDFKEGTDISQARQTDFDSIASKTFEEQINKYGNRTDALRHMGMLLVQQQDHLWSDLKYRAQLFGRTVMMIGNEPNKEAMERFYELEALEEGLNTLADGDKVFMKYMGDSYADYEEIRLAIERTSTTPEEAWKEVAVSREQIGAGKKRAAEIARVSSDGMQVGLRAVKTKWEAGDKWYIPDFIEHARDAKQPFQRVAYLAGQAYDQKIAEGKSAEVAERFARQKAYTQLERWGGELLDTRGANMKSLLGTSDTEGAFNTMLQDPEFGSRIDEMFGLTAKELFFGQYSMQKRLKSEAKLFEDPNSPEVLRRYKEKRKGKSLHTFPGNITKNIDVRRGTLDLSNDEGDIVYSIPLRAIGDLHNAKLQGVDDIARLDRLYSPEFLSTDSGRLWHDQQADANNVFSHDILGTSKFVGRTLITQEEYNDLPEKIKTKVRKEFYRDNYNGAIGTINRISDFFGLKRRIQDEAERNATDLGIGFGPGLNLNMSGTKALLKRFEGLRLQPYEDSGGRSIGYGHKILPGENLENITKEQAEKLFESDFAKHQKAAMSIPGYARASANRKAALIGLTYNMGTEWYKNWDETPAAIARGDYERAAELLEQSSWYKQVGKDHRETIIKLLKEG